MLMTWPILSVVTFLPLVGALLVLVIRGDDKAARRNVYYIAFWTTLVTFLVSLLIWTNFDKANPGFQFVEEAPWLGGAISYRMGVDGISMLFVFLTTFLMPLCIVASRLTVGKHFKEYMIAFVVFE
jgi:NADH-quinone oxidoreductase subunit M